MRVLLCTPVFPPARGGIETTSLRLATMLDGCDVRVVCLNEPGAAEFDAAYDGIVDRVANVPRGGRRALLKLNATVARVGWEWRPDVTLAMHVAVAPAARVLRRTRGVPYVAYIHAKEARQRPYAAAAAMSGAARVVTVSRYAEALAVEAGADPARLRRVNPGVDLPTTQPIQRDAAPTLVTVSRLEDRNKGHDLVVEALPLIAKRVPDVRWVVIGEGPLRAELERQAASRGVADRVTFVGGLSDAERDRWLERASLFVMPTRRPLDGRGGEGFGMVYVEAAAHGLPSIASRVPGVVDAVIDGQTGVLVEPQSAAAVASAVAGLLADPERLTELGVAARERAKELDWNRVATRAKAVLLEATTERTRMAGRGRVRRHLWPADLLLPLSTARPFSGHVDPSAGL